MLWIVYSLGRSNIHWLIIEFSGSRNGHNASENDRMCQFLGSETEIMGERYYILSTNLSPQTFLTGHSCKLSSMLQYNLHLTCFAACHPTFNLNYLPTSLSNSYSTSHSTSHSTFAPLDPLDSLEPS